MTAVDQLSLTAAAHPEGFAVERDNPGNSGSGSFELLFKEHSEAAETRDGEILFVELSDEVGAAGVEELLEVHPTVQTAVEVVQHEQRAAVQQSHPPLLENVVNSGESAQAQLAAEVAAAVHAAIDAGVPAAVAHASVARAQEVAAVVGELVEAVAAQVAAAAAAQVLSLQAERPPCAMRGEYPTPRDPSPPLRQSYAECARGASAADVAETAHGPPLAPEAVASGENLRHVSAPREYPDYAELCELAAEAPNPPPNPPQPPPTPPNPPLTPPVNPPLRLFLQSARSASGASGSRSSAFPAAQSDAKRHSLHGGLRSRGSLRGGGRRGGLEG